MRATMGIIYCKGLVSWVLHQELIQWKFKRRLVCCCLRVGVCIGVYSNKFLTLMRA
jgi:hypothetical protein